MTKRLTDEEVLVRLESLDPVGRRSIRLRRDDVDELLRPIEGWSQG